MIGEARGPRLREGHVAAAVPSDYGKATCSGVKEVLTATVIVAVAQISVYQVRGSGYSVTRMEHSSHSGIWL